MKDNQTQPKYKMELELIKPFGPSILKARIPIKILTQLNEHIDKLIEINNVNTNFGKKLDFVCSLSQHCSTLKEG